MTHPGCTLRSEIQSGSKIAPFIGIFDAFSATVAARHSPNLFYSGFGFAASHYGLPDLGYIAWTDIVQATWRLRQILLNHKLLVDERSEKSRPSPYFSIKLPAAKVRVLVWPNCTRRVQDWHFIPLLACLPLSRR
jgi:hypothetical protein